MHRCLLPKQTLKIERFTTATGHAVIELMRQLWEEVAYAKLKVTVMRGIFVWCLGKVLIQLIS